MRIPQGRVSSHLSRMTPSARPTPMQRARFHPIESRSPIWRKPPPEEFGSPPGSSGARSESCDGVEADSDFRPERTAKVSRGA